MINVVIVEDEMLVRLGMKLSIENANADMYIQGAFSNAEAALQFMDQYMPDVLITDIRLTGISGLEMIERLGKKRENMLIIVLSCYEDFSYARRAYELGVHKYILKHELEEDDLVPLIQRLLRENQMSAKPAQSWEFIEPPGLPHRIRLSEHNRLYVLGLICMQYVGTAGASFDLSMAAEVVQELLGYSQDGACFLRHEELLCILSYPEDLPVEQIRAQTVRSAGTVCATLTNYFNRQTCIVVSAPFPSLQSMKKEYTVLKEKCAYVFYAEDGDVVWAGDTPKQEQEAPPIEFLQASLFTQDFEQRFTKYLTGYFETCNKQRSDPRQVKVQADRLVHAFDAHLRACCGTGLEELLPREKLPDYFMIDHCFRASDLRDALLEMVLLAREAVLRNSEKETAVARIVEYVEQNCTSCITLGEISEKFHLSSVYVCQIFKKKTGVTLTSYINRLRIEKAKTYLATTDLSVEQIAGQIGFENPNYFSRLFKSTTGETAGAYKYKIRNKA